MSSASGIHVHVHEAKLRVGQTSPLWDGRQIISQQNVPIIKNVK